MDPAPDPAPQAAQVIAQVMRADRGRLLAWLIGRLRDFQLAEDALQDAVESALLHWDRRGIPFSPGGWLLHVALRKAIDRLRAQDRQGRGTANLALLAGEEASDPDPEAIPDERLRLIFTCCHPALEPKSRVALTLRTLGGLTTAEIARAFLDQEPTMGQRLSRARAKIAAAGIPFAVPGPELWAERLDSVLTVIYLIFNEGYSASAGEIPLRAALCEEAIYLARLVDQLRPGEAEVEGLIALMLLTHARCAARLDKAGDFVRLQDQDRTAWDATQIEEGLALLDRAVARRIPGPFQIKAAIAALHVSAPQDQTDWWQIVMLYDSLLRIETTPIVRLNRAVALAEAGYLDAALRDIEMLAVELDNYQPFHAAKAELLARAGRRDESSAALDRAIELAPTSSEAAFLRKRRLELVNLKADRA
ncbi:MAG: RNA polymerase [Cereibacter sphaeroides]|uniref:RNA polymerase n=1 Tax=Cereibacter sphaeroides TaxID=1063 RepID=A0A2W5SBJ8_CERSP|nr:MAG: RNA polymerase [Cereibacter sphaeroides]